MAQLEKKLIDETYQHLKIYGGLEALNFKQTVNFINERIEELIEDSDFRKNQIIVGWICKYFELDPKLFPELYGGEFNEEQVLEQTFKDNIDSKNPVFNLLYPISESYEFVRCEDMESSVGHSRKNSARNLLKEASKVKSQTFADDSFAGSIDKGTVRAH